MPPSAPVYASRRRRFYAFLIDYSVVAGACWLVGQVLSGPLSTLGPYGRVIGALVGLVYFGVLDSRIGHGQTLGKRLLGIRVVGPDGSGLSPLHAALRFAVLAMPLFLNGLQLANATSPVLLAGQLLVVFGLGVGLLYLFVFNAPTHQSLHDLCGRAFTVTAGAARISPDSQGPGLMHTTVAGALVALTVAMPVALEYLARDSAPSRQMRDVRQAIAKHPSAETVRAVERRPLGEREQSTLHVEVTVVGATEGRAREAHEMLKSVIDVHPDLEAYRQIVLVFRNGWDLGFVRSSDSTRHPMTFADLPSG